MTRDDTGTPSGAGEEQGLYGKYHVAKWDPEAREYEAVDNCFVLRPDKDPAAVAALRAYAGATDNQALAFDLSLWLARIGDGQPSIEDAAERGAAYRRAIEDDLER